jgi:CBS domain-containing protein
VAVKELMIKDPITATPETTSLEAIKLMVEHKIGCLPVIRGKQLIGIVTENDFVKCSNVLFHECGEKK